jgi:dTMP kinase
MSFDMYKRNDNAIWMVLEGIDGCGKTSVGREVVERLTAQDKSVDFLFEPSDLPIGRLIRQYNKGDYEVTLNSVEYFLMFTADRIMQMRTNIIPGLNNGVNKIEDRHVYASIAYQGGEDLSIDDMLSIHSFLSESRPNKCVIIDAPPEVTLNRAHSRGEKLEVFETNPFLTKVRANYLELARRKDLFPEIEVIDGTASFEEVTQNVLSIYKRLEK